MSSRPLAAAQGWRHERRFQCAPFHELARYVGAEPVGVGPEVQVVGDACAAGYQLPHPRHSWVATFAAHARVSARVNAFAGTGFAKRGRCGAGAFAERVRADDATVLQGGLSDTGVPDEELYVATADVIRRAKGLVLVVGPVRAPGRFGSDIQTMDRIMAAAARDHGAGYVSMVDLPVAFNVSQMQLNPAGHAVFGHAVAEAWARLCGSQRLAASW